MEKLECGPYNLTKIPLYNNFGADFFLASMLKHHSIRHQRLTIESCSGHFTSQILFNINKCVAVKFCTNEV